MSRRERSEWRLPSQKAAARDLRLPAPLPSRLAPFDNHAFKVPSEYCSSMNETNSPSRGAKPEVLATFRLLALASPELLTKPRLGPARSVPPPAPLGSTPRARSLSPALRAPLSFLLTPRLASITIDTPSEKTDVVRERFRRGRRAHPAPSSLGAHSEHLSPPSPSTRSQLEHLLTPARLEFSRQCWAEGHERLAAAHGARPHGR